MSNANSTHINISLFQSNPAVSKIAIVAKIMQPVIIPPLNSKLDCRILLANSAYGIGTYKLAVVLLSTRPVA